MTRRWLLSLPFVAPFAKKVAAQTYTTPSTKMVATGAKALDSVAFPGMSVPPIFLDVDLGDGRKLVTIRGTECSDTRLKVSYGEDGTMTFDRFEAPTHFYGIGITPATIVPFMPCSKRADPGDTARVPFTLD